MSNIITKRVSMYVRIKPEFKKDFDFEQIIIRLGFIPNPRQNDYSVYGPTRDLLHNIRIFVTEANGTPRNKEISLHPEVMNEFYNRTKHIAWCCTPHSVAKKEAEIETYVKGCSEDLKFAHNALELQSCLGKVSAFIDMIKRNNEYSPSYRPKQTKNANQEENIVYGEIKAILNKLVGMVLGKDPRPLDARTLASPICFASLKSKQSDFKHDVYIDETIEPVTVEKKDPAVEIAEYLLLKLKETRSTLAMCRTGLSYSVVKDFLEAIKSARRNIPGLMNLGLTSVIGAIGETENALDKIDDKVAETDNIVTAVEAMKVVFGPIVDNLETALTEFLDMKHK